MRKVSCLVDNAVRHAVSPVVVMACCAAVAEVVSFHPSDDVNSDRCAEVQRCIGAAKPGDELFFTRGDYYFSDSLFLCGQTNLALRAEAGTVFRFRFRPNGLASGAVTDFRVDKCSDIRFEGVTCTTDNPVSVSGRVVAVHPDAHEYDVRLEGDSVLNGTEPLCTADTCDVHGAPDRVISWFHLNEEDVKDDNGRVVKRSRGIPYKVMEPGLIRVEASKARSMKGLTIGHRVVYRLAVFGGVCGIRDSRRISFSDFTVWRSPGLSFVIAPLSADIAFDGLRICPQPGSKAIYSSNADGIHVAGMSGTLTLKNCLFDGFGDDPLNVHGKAAELSAYDPESGKASCGWRLFRKELRPMNEKWAVAGDVLAVYSSETFMEKGRATVKSVRGEGEYEFAAVEGGNVKVGDILINTRDRPRVRISDCTVRNVRSRGFLLQSQDVVVSNCTFAGTGGSGIMVAPDINNWYESGPTMGLTIRDCRFERCGVRPSAFGAVTVKVNHEGAIDAFPAGVHRDIEISGCSFRESGCGATNICIAAASSVKVSSCSFERQRAAGDPVVFVNCEDVDYDGLK